MRSRPRRRASRPTPACTPRRTSHIEISSTGSVMTSSTSAVPWSEPFIAAGPRSTSGNASEAADAASVTAAAARDRIIGARPTRSAARSPRTPIRACRRTSRTLDIASSFRSIIGAGGAVARSRSSPATAIGPRPWRGGMSVPARSCRAEGPQAVHFPHGPRAADVHPARFGRACPWRGRADHDRDGRWRLRHGRGRLDRPPPAPGLDPREAPVGRQLPRPEASARAA